MTFFKIVPFLLLFLLASCSSGEKLGREDNEVEAVEDGMFLSEPDENGVVELIIPEVQEYTEVKKEAEVQANQASLELSTSNEGLAVAEAIEDSVEAIGTEEKVEEFIAENEEYTEEPQEDYIASNTYEEGEGQEYIVQKNDSLMLISFKLYQNFEQWKDLADWNGITSEDSYTIYEGQKLKFKVSDQYGKEWNPSGNPYLVKVGDYLGLISKNVYQGQSRFWYDIWRNNDVLIKDPNRIFAGFTLYTESFEKVKENERLRMEEYKRKYGKTIRKRDLAGALDPEAKL